MEDQVVDNTQDAPLDNSESTDQVDSQSQVPQQPQVPDIDYRALYAQSVRERQQREMELEAIRQQQYQAPKENLDVTDADIEKLGTVETISRIVRKQLQDSLADVGEISRDFKRQKQMDNAEASFYQQFPHLVQYRDVLSSTIRGQLQNAQQVDPATFATQAFATIGYYTAMNAATPAQAPVNNAPPPRQTPQSRTNGVPTPTSRTAPKLSELERTAMRRAGFDPNKREDVDSFFAIVNNDEGITV
jgi:hypothetical protein